MLCHQHLPGERRHMFLHVVVHPHRGLRRLGAAGRLLLLPLLLLLPMPVLREVQEEKQQGAEQFAYEKQAQRVMVRRGWGGRRKVE